MAVPISNEKSETEAKISVGEAVINMDHRPLAPNKCSTPFNCSRMADVSQRLKSNFINVSIQATSPHTDFINQFPIETERLGRIAPNESVGKDTVGRAAQRIWMNTVSLESTDKQRSQVRRKYSSRVS